MSDDSLPWLVASIEPCVCVSPGTEYRPWRRGSERSGAAPFRRLEGPLKWPIPSRLLLLTLQGPVYRSIHDCYDEVTQVTLVLAMSAREIVDAAVSKAQKLAWSCRFQRALRQVDAASRKLEPSRTDQAPARHAHLREGGQIG